jgi:hypothetical protein
MARGASKSGERDRAAVCTPGARNGGNRQTFNDCFGSPRVPTVPSGTYSETTPSIISEIGRLISDRP